MTMWDDALDTLHQACRGTFGVAVTYIPSLANHPDKNETPVSITGILSSEKAGFDAGGLDVAVRQNKLEILVSELGFEPKDDDSVVINEITYRVVDVDRDPFSVLGVVILLLSQEKNLFS